MPNAVSPLATSNGRELETHQGQGRGQTLIGFPNAKEQQGNLEWVTMRSAFPSRCRKVFVATFLRYSPRPEPNFAPICEAMEHEFPAREFSPMEPHYGDATRWRRASRWKNPPHPPNVGFAQGGMSIKRK